MIEELRDEIKVRPGETEDDYIYRMCALHDQYDVIWDDVASIINAALGFNHTESWARRKWKAYSAANKEAEQNTRLETEEPDANEQSLREKFASSSEKLEYIRNLRQDARFERFFKNIADAIVKVGRPDVPMYVGKPLEESDMEYVTAIADPHIGANFTSINNSYSIAEAERRFNLAAQYLIKFVKDHGISKLTILSLGDLVQGILRVSDLKLNETEVVNAFVFAIRLIAGFLNKISKYCYIDYIHICYSNHEQPRYLGTKASELAGEDMGKISFAYLQDVLVNNPRINVIGDPDRDYYEFNIFDFKCFAAHGHQVKNLVDISKDLANRHRTFYDYVFLAHSHSAKELIAAEGKNHDIEILVAPSMIGSDPYADKLYVGSKAAIKVFGFDRKYGHTESYKYILN